MGLYMKNFFRRSWQHLRANKLTYFWWAIIVSQIALHGRDTLNFLHDGYRHWGEAARADAVLAKARCDRVVGNLLTTTDPVDVQRDGVILQHMDCSIPDRLPK